MEPLHNKHQLRYNPAVLLNTSLHHTYKQNLKASGIRYVSVK